MRNFKRMLAFVLAVIMVVGTFAATVSAATRAWYQDAVDILDLNNISNIGKDSAEPLTRNEFVMWIAKIESLQLSDDAWNDEIADVKFNDVTEAHHKAAIAYSHRARFIQGDGDGNFRPDDQITLAEMSTVIVRLMRYESLVDGEEGWGNGSNYIREAARTCRAFDQVFYKNSNTMDPEYGISKGEGAYVLATIMNLINEDGIVNENNPVDKKDLILTADDIDLGARFQTNIVRDEVYYIAGIVRTSKGLSAANSYVSVGVGGVDHQPKQEVLTQYLDTSYPVVLRSEDGRKTLTLTGDTFLKALRVSLGLPETPDYMNEETEIKAFDYVNEGTLVNIKAEDTNNNGVIDYKEIKKFEINTNSVVVDTYLQISAKAANAAYGFEDLIGYSVASVNSNPGTAQWKPVLSSSYNASMATSWTNISYDSNNEVTSAVLNFKGQAYKYGTDIVAYDEAWNEIAVKDITTTLINAAQGECYAVFHDIDADGLYETIYVKESHPFVYATTPNIEPASASTKSPVMSSISNGETLYGGNAIQLKNNAIGAVIYDREVGLPNGGGISCSDPYNLTAKATGKLQLILVPSNMRPAGTTGNGFNYNNDLPQYYTVADLASFYTGIIQEVSILHSTSIANYYKASILCTDNVIRTVYIPVTASEQVKLDISVGGATAEYTFDSSNWFNFLETTKIEATKNGIVSEDWLENPDVIDWANDANYQMWTAAWMAGRYVQFAIDSSNEVIFINGTDTNSDVAGFITNVAKTETGDNTYNVTIADVDSVSYTNDIKYYNANNKLTVAQFRKHLKSGFFTSLSKNDNGTPISIKANDGNTYYKCSVAWYGSRNDVAWISNVLFDGTNYSMDPDASVVYIDEKTGNIYRDANGNYTTDRGQSLYSSYWTETYESVSRITTTEVRASASGIFDTKNFAVYTQIFNGTLLDPKVDTTTTKTIVNPGSDLIYVVLKKDAGSYYLAYTGPDAGTAVKQGNVNTVLFMFESGKWRSRWYGDITSNNVYDANSSWREIDSKDNAGNFIMADGHILAYAKKGAVANFAGNDEIPATDADGFTKDVFGTKNGYVYYYDMTVGYGPYYERTYNATNKAYAYEIFYEKVVVYENVIGISEAVVDTNKTLMIPVYVGGTGLDSVQAVAKTEEDKQKYRDELGIACYIDDDGKVFALISTKITYKTDKDGNLVVGTTKYIYNAAYAGINPVVAVDKGTVSFKNNDKVVDGAGVVTYLNILAQGVNAKTGVPYELAPYANLTAAKTDRNASTWFYGSYDVTLDGDVYQMAYDTTITLITPATSMKGFTTTTMTVEQLAALENGLFITEWNATFEKDANGQPTNGLGALVVLGQVAETVIIDDGGDEPVKPEDKTLVYLDGTASAIVKHDLYSKNWLVISDKTAYAIPSGEEIGAIYRSYSTYEEALDGKIDLDVKGGQWYYVNKDNEIVGGTIEKLKGTITDAKADGTIIADMNIEGNVQKKVVISDMKVEFFYKDAEGNKLLKAGDNKNVKIIAASAFEDLFKTQKNAVANAQAAYDTAKAKYDAGQLSDTRMEYYTNELETAKQALADAKASNLDTYFNGQFWGFANNPVYKNFALAGDVFQQGKPTLTFEYVIVDGVLCVFSDSFSF